MEKIKAPLLLINSADDFINPPELGIAEREIKRVPNGRFVLLPASDQTHGHGTHTWAAVWQKYLAQLLEASARVPQTTGRKVAALGCGQAGSAACLPVKAASISLISALRSLASMARE